MKIIKTSKQVQDDKQWQIEFDKKNRVCPECGTYRENQIFEIVTGKMMYGVIIGKQRDCYECKKCGCQWQSEKYKKEVKL